jgi:asparagine synthase (glutamine-hydrolysing)
MCGVAAIYSYHQAALPVDRRELLAIRDHMTVRGPDDKGDWLSDDRRVGIAHRRLSIIDLSARGRQPMSNSRGNLVLSFNGEIYNYQSLRNRLISEGRSFRTDTDTEVILQLYEMKGEDMLHDLRGMFAIALWDQDARQLLLARDPYGIKPLYYANDGWTIRVASQVKALLAGGRVSRQADPAGHVGYFLFGSVPEPFTTYQEIRSVPAGSVIRIDDLGVSDPWRWASIPAVFRSVAKNPVPSSREEAQEVVRSAVRESVRHHFVGDVPVGVFLSSGVDSTALVGIASELGRNDLRTVTLAFSEFAGRADDESPCAERAAKFYGTDHATRWVSEAEFRDDLQKMLDAMDQPSIDGMNTWMISKKAAELGLRVCLSGLGADELFGGYPSFSQIPRWVRAMSVPSRIPLVSRLWHVLFKLSGAQAFGVSPKAAEFAKYAGTYPGAYLLKRGLFLPSELPELLGREFVVEGLRRLRVLEYVRTAIRPDPGSNFARVASMEACLYLRNQLLRDADWAGMAHSVEIRTPFVDTTLLGRVAPVAFTPYARLGKSLLAASPAASSGVDLNGNLKTGFSIPMEPWIANLRSTLDAWRGVPSLARDRCHWARRLAYSVYEQVAL